MKTENPAVRRGASQPHALLLVSKPKKH